ncbi:MAG: glucosaminidase domain-containing protein [Bacteroidaceae bacterium]|nr:glucosaminidase domain-containing protein [Bacteroidaceae bacterium]
MNHRFSTFLIFIIAISGVYGQTSRDANWSYVERYKDMAVDQMQRYRIPASITLAQGICESSAGRSRLAREGHNHFGIKVGVNWKGPYMVMADDRPNDRFRVYRTDDESFEDHSRFLHNNKRYSSLFNLKITDYKAWAHGLKRCGYATNPNYAPMLIGVIERYNLSQFDSYSSGRYHSKKRSTDQEETEFFSEHIVYKVNKCYLIVANSGDTWERVARETGVSASKLRKYNERPDNYLLRSGDIVYLTKKRSKGDKSLRLTPHRVEPGESMYDISQRYAIKLKSLYKLNALSPDYVPQVGDFIWLR